MSGPMELLQELHEQELIADIDWHFARFIGKFDDDRPEVALGAALASVRTRGGHVCLDLAACAGASIAGVLDIAATEGHEIPSYPLPSLEAWREALLASPVVAGPGCSDARPLVLDERGRLYLARYRNAESRLTERLHAMVKATESPADLDALLDRLFDAGDNDQRRAARAVLGRRLCVVTGGPGTGKTHLAARLIALFLDLDCAKPDRIALAAPTGKAAARLQESVTAQLDDLAPKVGAVRAYEARASTVHRLLYQARRGELPVDAVVLDEASMVDLTLMSRLVEALPEEARLVVLGDAHQLASVQPGAVLGDLCAAAGRPDSPLAGCVVELTESHRFTQDGGIGRLAQAIVSGDHAQALAALRDPDDPHTESQPLAGPRAFESLAAKHATESWLPCFRDPDKPFPALRVLCSHRHGPFGTVRFNRLVEAELRRRGAVSRETFYPGRPIIVTRNDRATELSNGDTGVVVGDGDSRRVWFPDLKPRDGGRFEVSPARLPEHESFFALTVHRAQGSEYDEVAFVPGPADSPVTTRELFYTAVTRAREKVIVYADEKVVSDAVARVTERIGGLDVSLGSTVADHAQGN